MNFATSLLELRLGSLGCEPSTSIPYQLDSLREMATNAWSKISAADPNVAVPARGGRDGLPGEPGALWLSGSALAGALPCWGKAHTGYASFGLGILSSDLPPDFESLRNSGPLQF